MRGEHKCLLELARGLQLCAAKKKTYPENTFASVEVFLYKSDPKPREQVAYRGTVFRRKARLRYQEWLVRHKGVSATKIQVCTYLFCPPYIGDGTARKTSGVFWLDPALEQAVKAWLWRISQMFQKVPVRSTYDLPPRRRRFMVQALQPVHRY